MTDYMFQHRGHGRVLQFGQFRLGHDPERQHVHQHQEQQHGDETDDGGFTNVAAFFFRAGREDARAFDADEHPHGDQHHLAHLVHHAAQVRVFFTPQMSAVKMSSLNAKNRDQDKQQQRYDFGDGGHQVNERCFLDSAQYQEMHTPEQHRRTDHGSDSISLAKKMGKK